MIFCILNLSLISNFSSIAYQTAVKMYHFFGLQTWPAQPSARQKNLGHTFLLKLPKQFGPMPCAVVEIIDGLLLTK
jgi:hypothetical protein